MRLVAISDTHQRHSEISLPPGDVLIHAGDWTHRGRPNECLTFLKWFASQEHAHKILICGNHELTDSPAKMAQEIGDIHYLENSSVTINGVKFYGSPQTPEFFNWAYMTKSDEERKQVWSKIPLDTGVLITHGPPRDILDLCGSGNVGDPVLARYVADAVRPQAHIFGHIHEGRGSAEIDGVRYYNVSSLCGRYRDIYPPTVIEVNVCVKNP